MHSGQLLIILSVAAVTLLAVAVLRQAGIPAPVVLVVAGLIVGFLPFVPDVSLSPDLVLLGLLPLLVYDTAVTSSPTAFFRHARSIGLLAVGLVLVTALGVAAVVHWIGHLSWPIAFVLGTAVGPTDASAATSIASKIGLPRRLVTILEGEALFNDATALVLYAAAVTAASTGHFSVACTAGSIVYSVAAGSAIGIAVGLIGRFLRNRIDDPPIEIAGSILLAYAAYLPAEVIHASGVLAAVVAGLYLGWHSGGSAFSARSRLQSVAFWQTLVFLVNAALFILVGLSFHTFTAHARGPVERLVLTGLAVVATVIALRLAWMWAQHWLQWPGRRDPAAVGQSSWRERLILGWSGMRGAITLAALLAVPHLTNAGTPIAGRDDIIYLGFAVIIATLVVQGMSLPALVRRLNIDEQPSVADAERQGRIALTRATIDYLGGECVAGQLPAELTEGMRAQHLARLRQLQTTGGEADASERAASEDDGLAMRRDLIAFQRRTLSDLRSQGRIGITTQRTIERDLDLEEEHLPDP